MRIKKVFASEILDSRGVPTIECLTTLEDGSTGWAAVPSGASTGKYEAVELRDNDKNRYQGKGVLKAVNNVNQILSRVVVGLDASDQENLDRKMIEADGTKNKSRLGANAILAVSLSAARAQAQSEKKPLYQYLTKFNPEFDGSYIFPVPEMNVINGGKHAAFATDIQEYMLFPVGASSIEQAIRMNVEVYQTLKKILSQKGYSTTVGDEGGFAPTNFKDNEEPFEILLEAIEKSGYQPGEDIALGLDAAASEFYQNGRYHLKKEGKILTSEDLSKFYENSAQKFPLISFEDPFSEDDWQGFSFFTKKMGKKYQVVGDDLYVTNPKRLEKGIKEKTTNSILIKLNQIGTLTETIQTILMAKKAGFKTIISHRSGETEDTFIADLAVAMGAGQIKAGAPARSERTAKYNRLLRIEREVKRKRIYIL